MAKRSKWSRWGTKASDALAEFVGSWTFVIVYTVSMVVWIVLHKFGVLRYDSLDFVRWNLWLAYFAGIQASIVLMSSSRQAAIDRKKHESAFRAEQDTSILIQDMSNQIADLEEIISDLIKEKGKP